MAQGKKLSFNLFVLLARDLYRFPEGSLSNNVLAGCEESARILLALSRVRVVAMDSMEGRGQPTTFSTVLTTLCSESLSPAEHPANHTVIPCVSIDSMVAR